MRIEQHGDVEIHFVQEEDFDVGMNIDVEESVAEGEDSKNSCHGCVGSGDDRVNREDLQCALLVG